MPLFHRSNNNNNNTPGNSSSAMNASTSTMPVAPRKSSDGSQATVATAPLSPLRARSASDHGTNSNNPSSRQRLNSRDIPRTYSGLYGTKDDSLLPFELNRHAGGTGLDNPSNTWILLGLYVTFLVVLHVVCMVVLPPPSWTWTHSIHTVVSIIYIHWLKGSMLDDSGEMDALTLWEQLEATQDTRSMREALMVIPCILCWVACHASNYEKSWCVWNLVLWVIAMLGKLPFMNGVRLFGINRTAGIDDATARPSTTSLSDQSIPDSVPQDATARPKTQ